MKFQEYLQSTIKVANEEKEILDELSQKEELSKIEIRAAKSSLQTMIENAIGKAKKILKHYNCPMVPTRSKDAFIFMYEIGLIDEERFKALSSAVGFRNSMIHDYMEFNENILKSILKSKKYNEIYEFLIEAPDYSDVLIKRIENFSI